MADTDEDAATDDTPTSDERRTAPMSSFDTGTAVVGALVALAGFGIAFGVPLAATGL